MHKHVVTFARYASINGTHLRCFVDDELDASGEKTEFAFETNATLFCLPFFTEPVKT